MKKIETQFNGSFAKWEIRLPPEGLQRRERGKIVQAGWAIWYLFGSDEHGEYLDYYASHRMTDDCHERIYSDGRVESLPAIDAFVLSSSDPEEAARLKAESRARNREISELLAEKGFGLAGDEPGGVQINRSLRLEDPGEE